jgi:hypothetical protein
VYHISGDEIKPRPVTRVPSIGNNLLSLCVSTDGKKLLYTDSIDYSKTDYYANLYSYDLGSENQQRTKLDFGVNNFAMNEDGSKIYYLKDKSLYYSDGSNKEKLADKVVEFHLNKKADRLIYRTQDCRLFQVTQNGPAAELDTKVYLVYVSKDLDTIYYFKENSLCSMKDGKDIQTIASGIQALSENIIHLYEDGSLYYLKRETLTASDYVNDDLAASDAAMRQPISSDYPDQEGYTEACLLYKEKTNRDEIRKELQNSSSTEREVDCLYYYSNGVTTKISEYCSRVWRYSEDKNQKDLYNSSNRPFLAYEQVKLDKMNISDVKSYADISAYILNYYPKQVEQFVCKGASILGKFADGQLQQLIYDAGNHKIYYTNNYHKGSGRTDLNFVEINGTTVSESKQYEKDILVPFDSSSLIIGNSVVYLKSGKNIGEDYSLFVNHEEIESDVIGWIHALSNASSFLFQNNFDDSDDYSQTLKLYQDGKVIKIADRVLSYHAFDEDFIVYVANSENEKRQLCLYDGSQTRILLDTYNSDSLSTYFITPEENPYDACWRLTVH